MRLRRDYLEYSVAEHCTLRCKGCTSFSPHLKPLWSDLDSYKKDVTVLANHLRLKRFRLLGGEPLLHKQLVEFVEFAKQSNIADRVGICTNGSLAFKVPEDIYKSVQFIDVSVYPNTDIDYIELAKFLNDKGKQYNYKVTFKYHKKEFQIINVDEKIEDEKQVQHIYDTCHIAHSWSCHSFFEGRYYLCSKPIHQNKYFDRIGKQSDINYVIEDGIDIHASDFRTQLEQYLNRKTPLKACEYCLGTQGPKFAHRQLSVEEIKSVIVK